MKQSLITVLLSVIGMVVGHIISTHFEVSLNHARADANDTVSTKNFVLLDNQGRRRISMGLSGEGSPGLWFFDENGKARLNLGVYGDGNPMIVLNDAQENAVEIFRTVGAKSQPVLVLKADAKDRVILGLNETSGEPYFVYYDAQGNPHPQFGHR